MTALRPSLRLQAIYIIGGKSDEMSTLQTAEMLQVGTCLAKFPVAPGVAASTAAAGAPASAAGKVPELTVSGATVLHPAGEVRDSVCNGEYAQAGTLNQRPIYRKVTEAGTGPAIYFDRVWKMSASGKIPDSFIFTHAGATSFPGKATSSTRQGFQPGGVSPWSDKWVTTSHFRLKSPPTVTPYL